MAELREAHCTMALPAWHRVGVVKSTGSDADRILSTVDRIRSAVHLSGHRLTAVPAHAGRAATRRGPDLSACRMQDFSDG